MRSYFKGVSKIYQSKTFIFSNLILSYNAQYISILQLGNTFSDFSYVRVNSSEFIYDNTLITEYVIHM